MRNIKKLFTRKKNAKLVFKALRDAANNPHTYGLDIHN